jgi:hypothetical protein
MINFNEFITEQKNTHMTHIEDKGSLWWSQWRS